MNLKQLIDKLKEVEHGFKHIVEAGEKLLKDKKINHFEIAAKLLSDDSYQARMLAVYLLGQISIDNPKALDILIKKVVKDENWRVQEMLAKALDHYCKTNDYKKSLPAIKKWLSGKNANLKRAVIEGFRIWTSRPYFKENPTIAIELISQHKADDSEYLRKSAGNALRDISRKHPGLIKDEISTWDLTNQKIKFTYKLCFGSD